MVSKARQREILLAREWHRAQGWAEVLDREGRHFAYGHSGTGLRNLAAEMREMAERLEEMSLELEEWRDQPQGG